MEIVSKTLGLYWRFLPAQQVLEVCRIESGRVIGRKNCANLTHFALMVNAEMCDLLQGECEFSPDIMMAIDVLEGKQATLDGRLIRRSNS